MRKTKHNHKKQTIKERGGWLSAWLILIIAHSAFAAFLILHLRAQQNTPSSPWFWLLLLAGSCGRRYCGGYCDLELEALGVCALWHLYSC
jgi:hypothetical protein